MWVISYNFCEYQEIFQKTLENSKLRGKPNYENWRCIFLFGRSSSADFDGVSTRDVFEAFERFVAFTKDVNCLLINFLGLKISWFCIKLNF